MKKGDSKRKTKDLPKIQNVLLYAYGCLAKLVGAVLFAIGLLLTALVLLVFKLLFRTKESFQKHSRRAVSLSCRIFILLLRSICFMRLKIGAEDRHALKALRSRILVANHPSLLDLPLLLSLVPGASVIIGPKLRLPLGVFRDVYTSATSWEQLHSDCRDCISRGGSLIIFPERLLTPREGTNPYRRTAARLSRECACDIQPLYIGGSDKYGLGTPTAPLAYCRTGIYLYELKLLPLIEGAGYTQLKDREASVAVTKKIHDEISAEAYLSDYRIV